MSYEFVNGKDKKDSWYSALQQSFKGENRMAVKVKKENCIACKACVDVCPVDAITMSDVAVINEETCIDCGTCVDECPNDAITL